MKKWVIIVLCAVLAAGGLTAFSAARGGRGARNTAFPSGLDQCVVTAKLDPETAVLSVTEDYVFTNRTGDTLDTVVFRTWLNAFADAETSPAMLDEIAEKCYPDGFSAGGMTFHDVQVNGRYVTPVYADTAGTALFLPVDGLKNGESVSIRLRFAASIPKCLYRTGYSGRVFMLNHVIPRPGVYENGAWRLDEYVPVGDPFVSECADVTLTLSLPDGFVPACSVPLRLENGLWKGSVNAVREIGLCVSDRWYQAETVRDGITLRSFAFTADGAAETLADAASMLHTFSELYGPYPWREYTVCETDFVFSGMETPCLTFISSELYGAADTRELTLAHETAHQWFYALVGSDSFYQPWQDEALAEYAMLSYVRKRYGQSAFETLYYYRAEMPMRENIAGNLTPGSPVSCFSSLSDYRSVVYGRGAALLNALDTLLPDGVNAFLKEYCERNAFRNASRGAFEELLNARAGMDVSPLVLDYIDTLM